MSDERTPPTTPPLRPGYYWQLDACGWRQVRPINWFFLRQYAARIAKEQKP